MPISSPTNNRVLNPNARAADVARATIQAAIPIQQRKADAAFQVNGYSGVLYSYLSSGLKCACQAKRKAVNTRLDEEGKAPPGVINELLIPGGNFGVRAYNTTRKSDERLKTEQNKEPGVLEVKLRPYRPTPVPLASLFDEDDLDVSTRSLTGSLQDRPSTPGGQDEDVATLLNEDDPSAAVHTLTDFDGGLFGYSDVSCPICFGSGYVGGYSLLSGYRKVVNFQDPTIVLPNYAVIYPEKDVPCIITDEVAWTILLPAGVLSVDAFRLWNVDVTLGAVKVFFDDVQITKPEEVLLYCNGRPVTVTLRFDKPTEFTHLEIQLNQSDLSANFELPKLNKSSTVALRETTDPFQVLLSPRIPYVQSMDVIVESTYGRALQVKSVSGLNDKRHATLGWEAEVRPVQPQELFWMLPRRRPMAYRNKPPIVRDNAQPNNQVQRT